MIKNKRILNNQKLLKLKFKQTKECKKSKLNNNKINRSSRITIINLINNNQETDLFLLMIKTLVNN
jgi:hypothetical protein